MNARRLAYPALAHSVSSYTSDQDRDVWYALQCTDRDPSLSISDVLNGGFVFSLPGCVPQPHFLQCACHCRAFCRCFMFLAAYCAPPLIGGGIKRCFCLTSVCLSRTSGVTREQRGLGRINWHRGSPRHVVTRTPLLRSKGQRSRSPGRFTQRGLNA